MILIIRPSAEADMAEATEYCARGGRFAAIRFVERLTRRLKLLTRNPVAGPVVYGRFRRLLLRPYPFGIYYHVENESIYVIAVLDLRQDPAKILRRLTPGQ